jgi:hypothetical protein
MYVINHSCSTIIDTECAAYIAIVEYGFEWSALSLGMALKATTKSLGHDY